MAYVAIQGVMPPQIDIDLYGALIVARYPNHIRQFDVCLARCRIPDDCIDSKRYPLFMARAVLQELIESLQSTQGVKPC